MAFIDIFNFKKYFSKPSDAQVARYGHVNALYDQLAAGNLTSAIYPEVDGDVDITTPAGTLFISNPIPASDLLNINLNNSKITTTSTIVFTVNHGSSASFVTQASADNGVINIRVTNTSLAEPMTDINISYIIVY